MAQHAKQLLPPEELALVDKEAFNDEGFTLSNSEAAFLLKTHFDKKREGNPNYEVPPNIKKTLDYVERFKHFDNESTLTSVRTMVIEAGVHEYEYAILLNLMPGDVDEAYTLLPSLRDPSRISEDKLAELLATLQNYREFT